MVRAKFKCDSWETSLYITGYETGKMGTPDYSKPITAEVRSMKFTPVFGDSSEENKKFFAATPSGQLTMGVVSQEAWKHFELGQAYYLDFTKA